MSTRAKVMFICFFCVALVLVLAGAFFSVQETTVEFVMTHQDGRLFTADEITSAADLNGKNILVISESATAAAVERAVPYAKVEAIERIFPTSVKIYVSQRVAHFAIWDGENFVLVDKDGKVLEVADTNKGAPIAQGITVSHATPGATISTQGGGMDKLAVIIRAFGDMQYLGTNFATTVQSVDFTSEQSCRLVMQSGVAFEFNGATNLYYQMLSFANWYSVNPDYRESGVARIVSGSFDQVSQRFDVVYTP